MLRVDADDAVTHASVFHLDAVIAGGADFTGGREIAPPLLARVDGGVAFDEMIFYIGNVLALILIENVANTA